MPIVFLCNFNFRISSFLQVLFFTSIAKSNSTSRWRSLDKDTFPCWGILNINNINNDNNTNTLPDHILKIIIRFCTLLFCHCFVFVQAHEKFFLLSSVLCYLLHSFFYFVFHFVLLCFCFLPLFMPLHIPRQPLSIGNLVIVVFQCKKKFVVSQTASSEWE